MSLEPWPLHQPIPETCLVSDVLRLLRISRRTFSRLDNTGKLGLVELAPIGRLRRFTGDSVKARLVSRWDGFPTAVRSIAHRRSA